MLRTVAEIIALADRKLVVAEMLLVSGYYDDAYYLGGYTFELTLKAKICNTLMIPDFFDFDSSGSRKLPVNKLRKTDKDNL